MKDKIEKMYRWKLPERSPHQTKTKIPPPLSDTVHKLQEVAGLDFGKYQKEIQQESLRLRWKEIAGPLGTFAMPWKYVDGLLVVRVEKPIYIQEFLLHQTSIISNIKKYTGYEVKRIKCEVGPVYWTESVQNESQERSEEEDLSEEKREFLQALKKLKS